MTPEERELLETKIRALCDGSDFAAATTLALRGYGTEIFSFLLGFLRDENDAAEVFAGFSERMWKGIPGFTWACSFRAWAYTVARNAARNYRSEARNRAKRFAALPDGSDLARIAEEVRTETRSYLKSRARNKIAELRDSLPEEDRVLLGLRVDRKLSWLELARILHDGPEAPTDEELQRSSAQLRKRYQRVKEKIVEMGLREGLIKRKDGLA